ERHDPKPDPSLREVLAQDWVVAAAVLLGRLEDLGQLVLEAQLLTERRRAPLEGQRAHRDLPAAVHLTDDMFARGAGAVEEHLAELRRAGELDDRADLDTGLTHGDEEVR